MICSIFLILHFVSRSSSWCERSLTTCRSCMSSTTASCPCPSGSESNSRQVSSFKLVLPTYYSTIYSTNNSKSMLAWLPSHWCIYFFIAQIIKLHRYCIHKKYFRYSFKIHLFSISCYKKCQGNLLLIVNNIASCIAKIYSITRRSLPFNSSFKSSSFVFVS